MTQFLSRHPALWRLVLAGLVIFISAFLVLTVFDWPSLTQSGAITRLARENGVASAPILLTQSAECQLLRGYSGNYADVWTLGFDGTQYQIAQLDRCVMNLFWTPWHYPGARPRDPFSFQIVTPSEEIPLQYRIVLAHRGAPRTDDDVFGEFTSTEYQALLFASPSIARVEARQQVTENNGAADWAADAGAPVAGTRLTDGVWQVRYTESRSNEQMQHTRFVGYDADGNLFEAVYAPTPPFA